MNVVFYLSAAVAIVATALVVTRTNAMHALLYLVVSLLAVAMLFFTLGAPFVAALEIIVYAGAIMVLFIFAIMLLNLGSQSVTQERQWLRASGWIGPAVLALILLVEMVLVLGSPLSPAATGGQPGAIDPTAVGVSLFSGYLLAVELASFLLLASIVGAYHIGQRRAVESRIRRDRVIQAKLEAVEKGVPEASPSEIEMEKEG